MFSPYEGMNDSWHEQRQRGAVASRRRRSAILRIVALAVATSIGAGVGASIADGSIEYAPARIGGGLVIGSVFAGLFLANFLVRATSRAVRPEVTGQPAALEIGWLLAIMPVAGALVGAPVGAAKGLGQGPRDSLEAYIGGLIGSAMVVVARSGGGRGSGAGETELGRAVDREGCRLLAEIGGLLDRRTE